MVMYACIFDLPDMQLMAGITYITIAAVAKTTWSQPMQNFKQLVADYEKGSDGASSNWALFGATLIIDGLTAPIAPP